MPKDNAGRNLASTTRTHGSTIGAGNLVEVEMAGDYEGYVTWYVSTQTKRPFNVFTLTGPPRLVVDICH